MSLQTWLELFRIYHYLLWDRDRLWSRLAHEIKQVPGVHPAKTTQHKTKVYK